MSDIELPPRPGGRHPPTFEGMLARLEELQGVGPTITLNGDADQRRDRGVAFDEGGRVLRLDVGMLLRCMLKEFSGPEKEVLLRAIGREVRGHVPEAADYLESWQAPPPENIKW